MNIRRRAIRARVERERTLQRQGAEMDASLARMQRVLKEFKAAGKTTVDHNEFWQRYHELGRAPEA